MSGEYSTEPMLDMFIFETTQNLEQLENLILSSEKSGSCSTEDINEIFRIMHTIKGSSAMMLFNSISVLAHSLEDAFYYIREQKLKKYDFSSLSDLVLAGVDFIKTELDKIKNGESSDGDPEKLIANNRAFLENLKKKSPALKKQADAPQPVTTQPDAKQQYYIKQGKSEDSLQKKCFKAVIKFEDGCEMENIRAYSVIHSIKEFTQDVIFSPENILDNDESVRVIREQGFTIYVRAAKTYDEMNEFFQQTVFLKELELEETDPKEMFQTMEMERNPTAVQNTASISEEKPGSGVKAKEFSDQQNNVQSIISVNVAKLDMLMDLVGEMVISEAMVTQNPDLKGLSLENFQKASNQLRKITEEIQDMVMAIRMVPLSTTFQKMNRVVRDMSKKLNRNIQLEIIGEETEVDKNIIEHISDPLMHLVRNSIDHGIEDPRERVNKGKPEIGKITLEAKNAGSDVLVVVRDDGKGLNKEAILKKAAMNGLLTRPENEMTDREIYNMIFLPGFSTKESVTEFSGRGVGMDVVVKNIEAVGGSVMVESRENAGSTITLKIPLTVAIIDGMLLKVGQSVFTLPITSIRESFRPKSSDLIKDPDNNEMIMVRGQCYPILRLHSHYGIKGSIEEFTDGILIMVEQDEHTLCVFADELIGQQQVVVKSLPDYIRKRKRKIQGVAGCTLLGDGSISLILDVGGLLSINDNQNRK